MLFLVEPRRDHDARREIKMERLKVVTLNIHKGLSHFNRRMVIHDLREGLQALNPAVAQAASTAREIDADQASFERFIVESAAVVSAVGSRSTDLEQGIADAKRPNDVADGLSHQRFRHRRNKRNRTGRGIGFVLSDDAVGLHPAIRAAEGDGAAKGHRIFRRWIRHQLGRAQTLGEISCIPQWQCRQPAPLIDVVHLLRGFVRVLCFLQLTLQGF